MGEYLSPSKEGIPVSRGLGRAVISRAREGASARGNGDAKSGESF